MSMTAGDETVQAGTMAKAIYDKLDELIDPNVSGDDARKLVAAALAQAIVEYMTANADVEIPADGIDSGIPSVDRTFGVT
jgi:20S proteasome alpha/beta subunit